MDRPKPGAAHGAQTSDRELRELASNIDERVRQIMRAEPKISPAALVNRMVGFMPGLHRIWTAASDDTFRELLEAYPAFGHYAQAIEDASVAYEKEASAHSGVIEPLPASLRLLLAGLMAEGGTLERRLQSLVDAAESHLAAGKHVDPAALKADAARAADIPPRYRAWVAGLQRMVDEAMAARISPANRQLLHRAFTEMSDRITGLNDRLVKLALAAKAAANRPGDETRQ